MADVNFFPVINRESALPVYVTGIGVGHEQETINLSNLETPVVHLHLTVSGCGIVNIDGKRRLLPIGTMMYKPYDKNMHIIPAPGGWKTNWVTIAVDKLKSSPMLALGNEIRIFRPKNLNEILLMYENINHGLLENTLNGRLKAAAEAYRMLLTVISDLESDSEASLADSLTISDAINYISRHLSERITLDELCEVCRGISPQYLCRLFRSQLGMRPTEYIRVRRIEYAKQLLANTDMQINDIASACGFESTTYFYRCWKLIEKESPADFRRGHKGVFV